MIEQAEQIIFKPQPGKQEEFLECDVDVCIYGGAAGSAKTYGMLLNPLHYIDNPKFTGVIFRRTSPEITNPGGIWDESQNIYPLLNADDNLTNLKYKFPSGAVVKFSHMQREKDKFSWQGAGVAFFGFEELTHFTKSQFFYMLSRNRSTSGVKPHIRATTNPEADTWVAELIAWYIDQDSGYPIEERSGVIRYFTMDGDNIVWGDSREELLAQYEECLPLSFTFISANIYDNKILLEQDPSYLAKLKALPMVERERLLKGNWKIKPAAGRYYRREYFEIIPINQLPTDIISRVRYWDLAGTKDPSQVKGEKKNKDPDWTVGLLMWKSRSRGWIVRHVCRFRDTPANCERKIKNIATIDGKTTRIIIEQDPGQAGVAQKDNYIKLLAGYNVHAVRASKDKITRTEPCSAQAEQGNIALAQDDWNEPFIKEVENFPLGAHDDQKDALDGAFNEMLETGVDYRILTGKKYI